MKIFITAETSKEVQHEDLKILFAMQLQVQELLDEKNYGDAVQKISIIPMVISDKFKGILGYKEIEKYSEHGKEAEFRYYIDFEDFINADKKKKKQMFKENIIKSIRRLGLMVKGDFESDNLVRDIEEKL